MWGLKALQPLNQGRNLGHRSGKWEDYTWEAQKGKREEEGNPNNWPYPNVGHCLRGLSGKIKNREGMQGGSMATGRKWLRRQPGRLYSTPCKEKKRKRKGEASRELTKKKTFETKKATVA